MTSSRGKIIFAGIFGNALEWYDFTAYAFFAPILAIIFFPSKDPFISLLMTFGVFAISFLVRPIGGILFGYLGDHFGRKKALIVSIITMTFPTLLVGFLPTYVAIGIAAPLLLTLLRIVQGIAVSGEITSATSFLIEHSHEKRRGFTGSLAMCSAFVGIVISSAVVTLITEFTTHDQLLSWGWRLPFLAGGLLGIFGLIIRLSSIETLHFQTAKHAETQQKKPSFIQHYSRLEYKPVVTAILLTCIMSIGNWFLIGYFNTFLIKTMLHPAKTVMFINFICLVLLTILLPIMGIISDKVGRKPVLMTGIIGFIVLIFPIFWLLQQPTLVAVFWGQFLFVLALAPITALIPATLAEMFHVHTRNSGISLGYNISLALFGGTAPLIALELVASTQNLFAPAWYLLIGAIISFVTLLTIKESYNKQLL